MSARDEICGVMLDHPFVDQQRADELLAAYRADVLREAMAKLLAWGEDGEKRRTDERSPFYMWEDADIAADLIKPDREAV